MNFNKDLTREQLEERVEQLMWNAQLGCYTRQAFENIVWPAIADQAAWIILLDVDKMKAMNDALGWDGTSAIIKRSIMMRSNDHKAGQVLSGDEICVVVVEGPGREPTDPFELCWRLLGNFIEQGASATFAFRKVTSRNYEENLKPLKNAVEQAKGGDRRGSISQVD